MDLADRDANDKRKRRMMKRQLMREEKIAKVPIENMTFKDIPPLFVSVVGPRMSGKSTLIRSIVKYFTQQSVDNLRGPITLSSSKAKRITLFEAGADIHQLVDASKISDLVIFTINASVGLEMETFEFLSLLMSHGLSKVLCVVTNVDGKGDKKYLKSIKKRMWAEICDGIKFFHLGKVISGRYADSDLQGLCRALGVMKCRPIEWKCIHPHIVVDRIDEMFVYGYVRGGMMKKGVEVHVPGIGDNRVVEMEVLMDPVPVHGESRLSLRSKTLYSPMSGITDEARNNGVETKKMRIDVKGERGIKVFKGSENVVEEMEDMETNDIDEECGEMEDVEHMDSEEVSSLDFEELKKAMSERFQKNAVTDEELVEKFNEKYDSEEKGKGNFLLKEKRRLEEEARRSEEMMVPGVVKPGQYVKIKLSEHVPMGIDFSNAIVLGMDLVSEREMSVIQGKIKRYKWYGKVLKTNEPLMFSVGWRRFQSIPVFSMKDATRNRVIKYTPGSMHCNVSFYGPVVPAGTGFSVYSENGGFRVLASGTVTDVNGEPMLVKKLKLVGYPREILHNTVFVRDMFNSDLEVLKFQGASLKAVSGLRGQVKGPHGKYGEYRATFEGKMLMSDIITLRCFVPVDVHMVFVPVSNLAGEWRGLRRLQEIREELGIKQSYGESTSGDESEEVPSEKFYGLPPEIESELPLDKRTILMVSNRIELPIPPDSREFHERREEMMKERMKKDEKEEEERKRLNGMKEKERIKAEGEREMRIKKTIHDSHKDKQRRSRK